MDTKAWIVVILCAIGMILYFPIMMRDMERSRPKPPPPAEGQADAGTEKLPGEGGAAGETGAAEAKTAPRTPADASASSADEEIVRLTSGAAQFELTNLGGGIARTELLNHALYLGSEDQITLNKFTAFPIGALGEGAGELEAAGYEIVSRSETEVVFERVNSDGVTVTKRFSLNPGLENDGYVINLDLTLKNGGAQTYQRSGLYLFTGSVAPLHPREWPQQTGFFWRDRGDMRFRDVNAFAKKGFLGIEFRGPKAIIEEPAESLEWAGVMDQFYTIVIANKEATPGSIWARRFSVKLEGQEEEQKRLLYAAEGGLGLPEVRLAPGESRSFHYEIYTGPKEFARLRDLGRNMREIMNYGNFPVIGSVVKYLSRFLVVALVRIEGVVGNYGIAIILITFVIRLVIWPLHAKSTRTMKRMAALSPMMTEMREKYKDDPQQLNQEMMKLYKEYGVNPFGGCLPVFLQLPIFLGFYRMLQSAVELRHQSFLWVDDLSMPDTLFTIPIGGGLPFNALPLLMGITMVLQMKVAPKTGDKTQQRIFMFMPLIFLFICYNFASALALYWTAQNIFSIGQTWYMSRRPEPKLEKKKVKAGSFADLMSQAKDRTKVSGQGPQQTKSKSDRKKKRRK